jgi:hypothetical protein
MEVRDGRQRPILDNLGMADLGSSKAGNVAEVKGEFQRQYLEVKLNLGAQRCLAKK